MIGDLSILIMIRRKMRSISSGLRTGKVKMIPFQGQCC